MARRVGGFGDFVDGFIFVQTSERVEIFSSSDIDYFYVYVQKNIQNHIGLSTTLHHTTKNIWPLFTFTESEL